jgi:hypothetical protein
MKIVFVAFNCKKDNSIMYEKYDWKIRGETLLKAINKGADFVSVRFIRK